MVFNRFSAKLNAKMSIQKAVPRPVWVTALFLLLTMLLPNLILGIVGDRLQEALYYLQSGYDPAEVFQYVFVQSSGQSAMFFILNLLIQLFTSVMNVGYCFYTMHIARNEQAAYRDIFYGFSILGKSIWINILIGLFTFLWTLLFMIPACVTIILGIVMDSYIMLALYPILMIAGIAGGIYMSLRYSLSIYFMIDEGCTSRHAINLSKQAMHGRVGEFFILQLTFIGWMLLSAITMGILSVWVKPYMEATNVNFYDTVRRPSNPGQDTYTGQVYNFGPGNQSPGL